MAPPVPAAVSTERSVMHRMAMQQFDYVFDWAAVIQLSPSDPLEGEARSLRCFAIPKGFSTHSGVRGHYLINTNQPGNLVAQVVTLPALVNFVDTSLPTSLAISFKFADNRKLYVQHIKLPLMACVNKESNKEMWHTDSKPTLSKLETIQSFSAVQNKDGCALGKQVDKWLQKHAAVFKALNLTSLQKCIEWQGIGRFSSNIKVVLSAAELSARRSVKQTAGGRSADSTSAAAGVEQTKAVELAELNPKLAAVRQAEALLAEAVPFYNCGLASRLVHLKLEPLEQGKEITAEGIEVILRRATTGEHAEALLEILKKGDVINLLTKGTAEKIPFASPLKRKTALQLDDDDDDKVPAPATASFSRTGAQDIDDNPADSENSDEFAPLDVEDEDEEGGPSLDKKKPQRRSNRAKESAAAAKTRAAEELAALAASPAAAVEEPPIDLTVPEGKRAKRAYVKTGMHSKDPETAALARARLGKAPAVPSTPSVATNKSSSIGSTKSTPLELAEISKLKTYNQELKTEVKLKEAEIRALQFELAAAKSETLLAISNTELKGKLDLITATDEAYEKGFARAMKNFEDVKRLISS